MSKGVTNATVGKPLFEVIGIKTTTPVLGYINPTILNSDSIVMKKRNYTQFFQSSGYSIIDNVRPVPMEILSGAYRGIWNAGTSISPTSGYAPLMGERHMSKSTWQVGDNVTYTLYKVRASDNQNKDVAWAGNGLFSKKGWYEAYAEPQVSGHTSSDLTPGSSSGSIISQYSGDYKVRFYVPEEYGTPTKISILTDAYLETGTAGLKYVYFILDASRQINFLGESL